MTTRAIVLDANILIRAVLGVKVLAQIADRAAGVNFLATARSTCPLPAVLGPMR
jgi:hypothetical protein